MEDTVELRLAEERMLRFNNQGGAREEEEESFKLSNEGGKGGWATLVEPVQWDFNGLTVAVWPQQEKPNAFSFQRESRELSQF